MRPVQMKVVANNIAPISSIMKNYTLEDAHAELCLFLNQKTLKDKPELILEYYQSQCIARAVTGLSDVLRGINLRSIIHGKAAE